MGVVKAIEVSVVKAIEVSVVKAIGGCGQGRVVHGVNYGMWVWSRSQTYLIIAGMGGGHIGVNCGCGQGCD